MVLGKLSLYATAQTLEMILKGPMYLGSNLPISEVLALPLKVMVLI